MSADNSVSKNSPSEDSEQVARSCLVENSGESSGAPGEPGCQIPQLDSREKLDDASHHQNSSDPRLLMSRGSQREDHDHHSRLHCREGAGTSATHDHLSRLPDRSRENIAFRYDMDRQMIAEGYYGERFIPPPSVSRYTTFAQPRAPPPDGNRVDRPHSHDDGFSAGQMQILQGMQDKQMQMFEQLLNKDKHDRPSRKRQRSFSPRYREKARKSKSKHRRHRRYESESSSSDSESESGSEQQLSSTTSTPSRRVDPDPADKTDDNVSVHADPQGMQALDDNENRDESNKANDKNSSDPDQGQSGRPQPEGDKIDQQSCPVLEDPHAKPKGEVFEQSVLVWWKSQRTHVLTTEQKEDFLGNLKPDSEIASFFKAPDLPESVREKLKQIRTSAWKDDNSLWSIQEDLLKASLPLVKAVEELQKKGETNRLLSSTGSLMGSVVQRLSVYRLRHAESVFKGGFLKDVSPSMSCLLGDNWTEQVEQEDKVNKVTQKVVKSANTESGHTGKQFPKKGKHFNKGKGHGKFGKYRKGKQNQFRADQNRHYSSYEGSQGQSSFRDFAQSQSQSQDRFQKDFKEKKAYRPGAKN